MVIYRVFSLEILAIASPSGHNVSHPHAVMDKLHAILGPVGFVERFVEHRQMSFCPIVRFLPSQALFVATAVALVSSGYTCHAGIVLPQPVSFDTHDLQSSLSSGTGASATSHSRNTQQQRSANERHQPGPWPGPLVLMNTNLPMGHSSSSSSSSVAGGGGDLGAATSSFRVTIGPHNGPPLRKLAEDEMLSLPDPPGNELLRPPQQS